MHLSVRLALAAVAGLAAALAYEPFAWAVLLPFAIAALTLLLRGLTAGRGALAGLVFGSAFMLALLPWIQVIGVDAWIGLSLLEGSFFALLGAASVWVMRLPGWPVLVALCWVAVEALRSAVPWGGFPWGRLAFATVDTPLAATLPYLGTAGTSLLVAVLGAGAAWAVVRRRAWRRVVPTVLVAAALVPAGVLLPSSPGVEDTGSVRIALVQGDVPGEGMEAFAERRAVLDNHVRATIELGERVDRGEVAAPDLVLWPENSTDIDPFADASVRAQIQTAVDAVGVPVLVGAMVGGPGPVDVRNEGIVWLPGSGPGEGEDQRYAKTHPVPFGEYIPHRKLLARYIERLDQIPRDMVPGTRPGLLDMGGVRIGDVICFEVAYGELVEAVVEGGAELLVVQTNNATYMGTGQVEQQFAITRLRALETGRYVAVVATNGVSGLVGPDGSVLQRAPVRTTSVLRADVPRREGLTPGTRIARPLELVCSALAVLAAAAGIAAGRRRRVLDATPATAATRPTTHPVGAGGAR